MESYKQGETCNEIGESVMNCTRCKENYSVWIEDKNKTPYCHDCHEIITRPSDLRHYVEWGEA